MDDAAAPLLLFVVGPPAVGKMSVGQAIAERTGLRLFHNHISIELAPSFLLLPARKWSAKIIARRLYSVSETFAAQ
jgi:hypothetical protein